MGKNYQKLYTDDVFRLAETLVIKSEDTADKINDNLINMYGSSEVDLNDRTTWKYYLNICGQYHPRDTVISVTSLDTLQTITFTRENLDIHVSTKKDYQYGTRNYNELVSIYPDMEMFILGVLYPADMQTAIAADEGTILSYPSILVESNEVTLIDKLNNWIANYKIRWYSRQFGLSDNYYTTVYLGLLYLNLVPAIINIRLGACKGPEAHSFHVRQYLLSHGMLDIYLDYLTVKQALFFYRNIQYIERNNGKRAVFSWLTEHLMSERGLPLSELIMRHDVSDMLETLYPSINFEKNALNISYNASERLRYNFLDLLAKEYPLVVGNPDYIAEHEETINTSLKNSLSSVVITKMLDSSVVDYTDATPYTKHSISINHWLYLSSIGKYSTYTSFKDPRTGDKITLHCKDAFIYFSYVYLRALGGDITTIPLFFAQRVTIFPRVTVESMMQVADSKLVTIKDAKFILSLQPAVGTYVSVEAFKDVCNDLFNCAQYQLGYISMAEHQYRRGIIENMIARTYTDAMCSLSDTDENMAAWILKKNIPTTAFSSGEYLEIYKELFENTTGTNLDSTKDLQDLQNAMVGLFEQLSSYTVQFLKEVNGSNIKVFNPPVVRLGDIKAHTAAQYYVYDLDAKILDFGGHTSTNDEVGTKISAFTLNEKNAATVEQFIPIIVTAHPAENKVTYSNIIKIAEFSGTTTFADPDLNLNDATSFIGYDQIWRMTDLHVGDIKDIYCDCFKLPGIKGLDLARVILDNDLELFIYLEFSNVLPLFIYKDISANIQPFTNVTDVKELNAFTSSAGVDAVNGFKANAEIIDVEEFKYPFEDVPKNIYVSDSGVPFVTEGQYIPTNFATIPNVYVSDSGVIFLTGSDALTPEFP